VSSEAERETTGLGFTFRVRDDVPVHPKEVPVTVYVVVVRGVSVRGFAVPKPPLQIYVFAPVAVNVVEEPAQMGFTGAEIFTTGF
jgi:hypothetical protein